MSSWLDLLPSNERGKIRKRLRSPEVYAETREKVVGPEKAKQDMDRNEALAELQFVLETEKPVQDALKQQVERDLREVGLENMLEDPGQLDEALVQTFEQGAFEVGIDIDDDGHDQMVVRPEGNVGEKLPVKKQVSDRYVAQFSGEAKEA